MNTSPRPVFDLKSAARLMATTAAIEHEDLGLPEDKVFLEQKTFVELGLFRLVVMGEIKKGKSSFINALCGIDKIVPVAAEVATSTVFKIRHGAALKYTVYFRDGAINPETKKPQPKKKETDAEEVSLYGTEKGNPGNIHGVDFIAIEAPSLLLKSGLVIVDTPGVGGVIKEHREITFRHAPRADGIFFVVDSTESPIGAEEVAFLKDLRRITPKIYFIQTKADLETEEGAKVRMRNNMEILTTKVGLAQEELVYFILSSELKLRADRSNSIKDLKESGFMPLRRYLDVELKDEKDRTIGTVALERIQAKLGAILPEISYRRKVLDANSAEKRQGMEAELDEQNQRLKKWQADELPALTLEFTRVLTEAVEMARQPLVNAFGGGGTLSENAATKLSRLESSDAVYDYAPALFDETRAEASFLLVRTCEQLEARLRELVSAMEDKVQGDVADYFSPERAADKIEARNRPRLEISANGALERLDQRTNRSTLFDRTRTAFLGGNSATMIGGAAIGTAIGIGTAICPGVGTAIAAAGSVVVLAASALGALLWGVGARTAVRTQKRREVELARREVRGEIDRVLSVLHAQAQSHLNRITNTLRTQAEDGLKSIRGAVEDTLKRRRGLLEERKRTTDAEIAGQAGQQAKLEAKAACITREVSALASALHLQS